MKKIAIVTVLLFIANFGCKKMNVDGGGLCGCSPVTVPELYLVLKNNAGADLLDEKTLGAYSKDQIELYTLDDAGKKVPVQFSIRAAFSYGKETFPYKQLHSADILYLQKMKNNKLYLVLGKSKTFELQIQLKTGFYELESVTINGTSAEKDKSSLGTYISLFYLTVPN